MDRATEMFKLGQAVFLEGVKKLKEYKIERPNFIHNRHNLIIKKRLAVVEFTHGLELILKAILIRKGYLIYKLKGGIYKRNKKIENLINIDRTIELKEVIKFFKKGYPNLKFNSVDKLRELRNQIIHRGTQIDEKKREYFIDAIDCLMGVYNFESIKHRIFLQKLDSAKSTI